MSYDHRFFDPKWQKKWHESAIFYAKENDLREKYYVLVEFPYPSGAGLHVGHPRSYTALDVIARKRRMEGMNVLFPMGWDAFGLPAENYAIKTGIHPSIVTKQNIETFRRQLQSIGFSFDWSREVDTTDPAYYKWTQWMFLEFFKHGLCYKAKMPINWCPKDKIGLANEEAAGGVCERCGTPVEKREKEQWMIAMTKYADRLLEDLKGVDYLPKIKKEQEEWIGRSEGAEIDFVIGETAARPIEYFKFRPWLCDEIMSGNKTVTFRMEKNIKEGDIVKLINWEAQQVFAMAQVTQIEERSLKDVPLDFPGHEHDAQTLEERRKIYSTYYKREITDDDLVYIYHFKLTNPIITVFTTRPDTVFGVTYVVLAPEHPLVSRITTDAQRAEVDAYVATTKNKTDEERGDLSREKTGVFTGAYAVNPANGEKVPIWVADYVVGSYGTGAVMAVPAHDERDWAFAKKYHLSIRSVVQSLFVRSSGDDALRPDAPFVKRKAAVCVIKHWNEEKYLCVKYKANTWQGFVIGGIEDGEEPIEAAMREIKEETGYQNMRLVRKLGDSIHSQFYHMVKKQNRWAEFSGMLFELADDTHQEIADDEKALADLVWISRDEVMSFITADDMKEVWRRIGRDDQCTPEKGILTNSDQFSELTSDDAIQKITTWLEEQGSGRKKVTYRLRDWVFSRQRYWGEPIPLVHCENGCASEHDGWVPVPETDLPVTLPQVEKYEPTDTGESPLSLIPDWMNTSCPQCGGKATRETDTMPNWAGSSWYFLRYADPHNDQAFASKDKLKHWLPVDVYNGGMEHATRHLLYARFWTKVLFDRGHVPFSEFCQKRIAHGLILAEDGTKMSKSKGNVVNPDDIVQAYGADTLRVYELFMGPFEEPVPWSMNGVIGVRRFLDRVVRMAEFVSDSEDASLKKKVYKTLEKITKDIEGYRFNTAVAALMTLVNDVYEQKVITKESFKLILMMLVPFAPHVANELWEKIGEKGFVEEQPWPQFDSAFLTDDEMTIAVQVNGKLRGNITVPADATDEQIVAIAKQNENVAKHLTNEPKKTIVVKGKIVNFVL